MTRTGTSFRRISLVHSTAALWLVCLFVMALTGTAVAPRHPYSQDLERQLSPPSSANWMGTDYYGRDVFSRIIVGCRITFMVGIVATSIGVVVGGFFGVVAGYFGGLPDSFVMRIMDIMLAFPTVLLALVLVALMGPGLLNVSIATGVSTVPRFARIVRSRVLQVKEYGFVESCIASGGNTGRILLKHIVPSVVTVVVVYATFNVAMAMTIEANLSFLGMGIQPPEPSWGAIAYDGRPYILVAPWISIFPGLALMLTVISLNVLGDWLRDILDPRLRI